VARNEAFFVKNEVADVAANTDANPGIGPLTKHSMCSKTTITCQIRVGRAVAEVETLPVFIKKLEIYKLQRTPTKVGK